MPEKLSKGIVEDWVLATTGIFTYKDLFSELDVMQFENRDYIRKLMSDLCKQGVIKAVDGRHGSFRLLDKDAPLLNWKGIDDPTAIDIRWPFELEKYVNIHQRNVIVIGGDPNQGKTAFLYNVISLNWRKHKIVLFDSENSEQELALRFSQFPDSKEWPSDMVRDRSHNFGDVIEPNSINLIDYLEIYDSFYMIGRYLREIRDPLDQGIAIVAIQKSKGADLPLGRDFSQQIARLVLTIDPGVLTIRKAKSPAVRNINPNNMKFTFHLEDGARFTDIHKSWELPE